jgi:alanine-glyoxylate transaminase/serine-glyoxylate transaminase/serine-pyruvate transaminase
MFTRYGATVERIEVPWGRAVDPTDVGRALSARRADVVAIVHAETSTGVRNPVREVAALARERDALVVVDAVTSLGAMPVDVAGWDLDACFSCSQKGLGAPSGLAPVVFSPRAIERRVACRSFYFDLALLEDYWLRGKYHHTISAPLVYALATALTEVEDEGLDARWARHDETHQALVEALSRHGLSLLPDPADRLWSLNAVTIPAGADDAAVRARLLSEFGIEIGAGLGPLAGRIWRVGLMGSGATRANVDRLMHALSKVLAS